MGWQTRPPGGECDAESKLCKKCVDRDIDIVTSRIDFKRDNHLRRKRNSTMAWQKDLFLTLWHLGLLLLLVNSSDDSDAELCVFLVLTLILSFHPQSDWSVDGKLEKMQEKQGSSK